MTTRSFTIELTASESAVFSTSAATFTTHLTAPYPKGANLLGWAARKLYNSFDKDIAHTVFHSGKVRFSDAVRVSGDGPAFPNPSILLEPKHLSGEAKLGRAAYDNKHNKDADGNPKEVKRQAEAVKGKLVTLAGAEATKPVLQRRLRSAKNGGANAEAALFDFQSIQPGQTKFRATIECDDNTLADDLLNQIRDTFKGTVQIGRGHVTTYGGGYSCEIIENEAKVWPERQQLEATCTMVRLWLLSDAAFINDYGSPNLEPGPKDFGLGCEWEQLNSETTATSRRIWPWNSTYGSRDMEYAVIEAGSVFTFTRTKGPAVKPAGLVGIGQERGFGRVAVLVDADFMLVSSKATDSAMLPQHKKYDVTKDPFVLWLKSRGVVSADIALDKWAHEQTIIITRLVGVAGREGPSRTQWQGLYATIDAYGKKGKDDSTENDAVTEALKENTKQPCWDSHYCGLDVWVKNDLFPNRSAGEAEKYKIHIKKIIENAIRTSGDLNS